MRTPWEPEPGVELVAAAQRGDRNALDALAAAYLPLVYNVVGRAMNGHPDVDDVVQETMLRAIRGLDQLRAPDAFRSWLVAIAIRQVRDSYRDRLAQAPAVADEVPSPDFADLTVQRLGLSGQRRETAEATRWLDEEDQPVLALWWQEAAGELSRAEVAEALGVSQAHAAVRVARMKERLVTSRTVVRALRKVPPCPSLAAVTAAWQREPSSLWRKRLARHVRDCPWCLADVSDMVPAERLLAALPLLPVPAALAGRLLAGGARTGGAVAGRGLASRLSGRGGRGGTRARGGRGAHAQVAQHARLIPKAVAVLPPKLVAVAVAVATVTAGGTFAAVHGHRAAAPAALSITRVQPATRPPAVQLARKPKSKPAPRPAPKPAPRPSPRPAPPVTVTSQRKGVSTWYFTGVRQALTKSGASWYYNWAATPNGIPAPSSAGFVPMIWGAADVTTATLGQVKREGDVLLGFNEPDLSGQANMTPQQALNLWPRLMATGMTLGSPAVADGAATPGGWLDQFMTGARARGYRVNFITVHWYGGNFSTGPAVQELETYLQAIYARYHLPIWVTEFGLTGYVGSTATFPAPDRQAAFMTAAAAMLDGLPYLQRYAWFALPASAGSGTTGLFSPGPAATVVGRAFEAAR